MKKADILKQKAETIRIHDHMQQLEDNTTDASLIDLLQWAKKQSKKRLKWIEKYGMRMR